MTVQITARLTRSRVDALLKRYPGVRIAEAIRRAVDDALAQEKAARRSSMNERGAHDRSS